jgi:hypothetical protein
VSLRAKGGQGWLDSLARWSVGVTGANEPPAGPHGGHSIAAGGTTRRTALRTAAGAGAVAALAPMHLLQPSSADAAETTLSKCLGENHKSSYADFQACVKNPLEELEALKEALDSLEGYLREQKKPAARKRLIKSIKRANREREQAVKKIEFCNFVWIDDETAGQRKCESENKQPPTGAGGGGATGGGEGCEAGFLLCADHCCNLANAYCQGCNEKIICCRIEADCCPSG